jgi:hypothetical protein
MSEVSTTLEALAAGKLTLAQAAERFKARQWPAPARPDDPALADQVFPPAPAGSFAEVAVAYSAGLITAAQYRALAEAVAHGHA